MGENNSENVRDVAELVDEIDSDETKNSIKRRLRVARETLASMRDRLETMDESVPDDPSSMSLRDVIGFISELDQLSGMVTSDVADCQEAISSLREAAARLDADADANPKDGEVVAMPREMLTERLAQIPKRADPDPDHFNDDDE